VATIEEQLRTWIDRETQRLDALGPDHLRGHNWCDVSIEEQEVFGLSPETVARVATVFDAYLAIADIALNELHGTLLCRAARKVYPWIEQGSTDSQTFIRFAKLFGVSNRQAAAFFWKHDFWQVRQGLVTYADEAEEDRLQAQSEAGLLPADHPRVRGLYPERGPVALDDPQVLVTIALDTDLYDWLQGFVGGKHFTSTVEETIDTALRCMRGNEPARYLDRLAEIVANARQITQIEALLGPFKDETVRKASAVLHEAAFFVKSCKAPGKTFYDLILPQDEGDRAKVLALCRLVLPDWDPMKEWFSGNFRNVMI
jgi:hypothetical protein